MVMDSACLGDFVSRSAFGVWRSAFRVRQVTPADHFQWHYVALSSISGNKYSFLMSINTKLY